MNRLTKEQIDKMAESLNSQLVCNKMVFVSSFKTNAIKQEIIFTMNYASLEEHTELDAELNNYITNYWEYNSRVVQEVTETYDDGYYSAKHIVELLK